MDFISSTNTVGVFYECFEIGYHSHSKNTPGSFLGMDTTSGTTTQMTNDPSTAMATDTTESGATGVIATTSITPVVRVLSFFISHSLTLAPCRISL